MKYCDVRTNSLKQYHKECMKNGVQKMHVDFKASDRSMGHKFSQEVLCYLLG